MSSRRISVDAGQYRRVLLEAITSLEALDSAHAGFPFANQGDIELLAWCRAQLKRVGGTIPSPAPGTTPIQDLLLNDILRMPS